MIPTKQPGQFRPLGIPCLRDRVAQIAAMLVLSPIFKADLQPEQHAYRAGCSVLDAVQRVHRLVNQGHREIVDGDLSTYFREVPHAELLRSVTRRVSDGRLLGRVGSSDGWRWPWWWMTGRAASAARTGCAGTSTGETALPAGVRSELIGNTAKMLG